MSTKAMRNVIHLEDVKVAKDYVLDTLNLSDLKEPEERAICGSLYCLNPIDRYIRTILPFKKALCLCKANYLNFVDENNYSTTINIRKNGKDYPSEIRKGLWSVKRIPVCELSQLLVLFDFLNIDRKYHRAFEVIGFYGDRKLSVRTYRSFNTSNEDEDEY